MDEIIDLDVVKIKVKNGKMKLQKKNIKDQVLKDKRPEDLKREEILKKARDTAHDLLADQQREFSNKMREISTLSESFDFIEESYGEGQVTFEFFDEPKESTTISEGLMENKEKYKMIGVAEGVFAPIGVMSRNNRIYEEDHYPYLLSNQNLVDRIQHRGMLGTIGHHDKKVDDQDLAEGKVSHIVTDLHIVENADGTKDLHGTLEIMDTPAGHLLKTYYEHGVPLYVSSRGGGKLLPVPNESYKKVDKTNYFLETFDVVSNPGFLQAKPKYINPDDLVSTDTTPEPTVTTMPEITVTAVEPPVNPALVEELNELKEIVKTMADRIFEDNSDVKTEECGTEVEVKSKDDGKEIKVEDRKDVENKPLEVSDLDNKTDAKEIEVKQTQAVKEAKDKKDEDQEGDKIPVTEELILDLIAKKLIHEKLETESDEEFRARLSEKYMDKIKSKLG